MKDRNLGHMIRIYALVFISLLLSSCATKPPVQAMAEARAAVQAVRPFYADQSAEDSAAKRYYQSAEQALLDATKALDEKRYIYATQKAHEAKRQARIAAKLKQKDKE